MLDHLSGGRLDLGVGRGRSPIELMLYGCDASEAQAMFDEVLTIVQMAFAQDRVNFAGKFFTFNNIPIELRPLQSPHPPMWYGIGSVESAEHCGTKGFNVVMLAKPDAAATFIQRFTEACARSGHTGKKMGLARFIVVGETDDDAFRLARRAYPVWHSSFFELFHRYGQKPVQTTWSSSFDEMVSNGLAFAGSPANVVAALKAQLEETSANYVVGQFVFGDMSLAESLSSIRLFAKQVMPALADAYTSMQRAPAGTA